KRIPVSNIPAASEFAAFHSSDEGRHAVRTPTKDFAERLSKPWCFAQKRADTLHHGLGCQVRLDLKPIRVIALRKASSSRRHLPQDLRGGHPRADSLELFHGYAVEAAFAAGLLDGPDDHPPDERGDLLHAFSGSIVPRDRPTGFVTVFDRRRSGLPWGDRGA